MHKLLLFGQVPAPRHEQVLRILAGLAAMQPTPIVERRLVYKPTQPPQRAVHVGGTQDVRNPQKQAQQAQQNKELFYIQLVEAMDTGAVERQADGMVRLAKERESRWSLQFRDVPEAGKKPAISRMASMTDIMEGDPYAYMTALGYKFVSQHVIQGHQVILDNVILLLHRILRFAPDAASQQPSQGVPPAHGPLVPLDGSGGYVIQACVQLQDGSKPGIITAGANELEAVKARLRGVVDLKIPDRLSMDTRVK